MANGKLFTPQEVSAAAAHLQRATDSATRKAMDSSMKGDLGVVVVVWESSSSSVGSGSCRYSGKYYLHLLLTSYCLTLTLTLTLALNLALALTLTLTLSSA